MTNHPDSNSELVRTFSTILRPNSYDLRRNTSYFDQFIIASIRVENRSMRDCHCNCAYSLSLSLSLWRKIGAMEKLEQREK